MWKYLWRWTNRPLFIQHVRYPLGNLPDLNGFVVLKVDWPVPFTSRNYTVQITTHDPHPYVPVKTMLLDQYEGYMDLQIYSVIGLPRELGDVYIDLLGIE